MAEHVPDPVTPGRKYRTSVPGALDAQSVIRARLIARGFSLIELLVVIAIIAILAALIMPAVRSARDRAFSAHCTSNLHQWGVFWGTYLNDHDWQFTDGLVYEGQTVGWKRGEWIEALRPYWELEHVRLLLCPKATRTGSTSRGGHDHAYKHGTQGRHAASYGFNVWMYNAPAGVPKIQGRPTSWNWNVDADRPSTIPIMLDSMWRGGGPMHTGNRDRPPPSHGAWNNAGWEIAHFTIDRHLGAINAVFMDGHAEPVGLKSIWNLNWHRGWIPGNFRHRWPAWMAGYPAPPDPTRPE